MGILLKPLFHFSGTVGLSGGSSTSSSSKMLSLDHHQQAGRVDIIMVGLPMVPLDMTLDWLKADMLFCINVDMTCIGSIGSLEKEGEWLSELNSVWRDTMLWSQDCKFHFLSLHKKHLHHLLHDINQNEYFWIQVRLQLLLSYWSLWVWGTSASAYGRRCQCR